MNFFNIDTLGGFAATYGALTVLIWARYFVIAGLFYWLLWGRPEEKVHAVRLSEKRPTRDTVAFEIKMSLLSSLIYAAPGTVVIEAYKAGGTQIYTNIDSVFAWAWIPFSILIYLVIHDTYFYWTHRAMHDPKLFRAVHLAHHRSRHPTPWAGFSFHPWESIISAWPLPLATFFIPIHIGAVAFLLVVMTVAAITNHAGWEILPQKLVRSAVGKHIISATHHNLHHTDYNANYGLYFRFWDKVMKTDKGLAKAQPAKSESV
ncbi:sterol desaturase family protein [Hyphococcus flavus]|uniref:Sterol desaturase family protein n=1 Tax=Hyphococcus flavus TaxID=1866326 RepID=A0AAE9ZBD8_9PROT|nr:sterol desaturase family protein [Hyphococcus flavus]WDI31493.1 sterol desaturase family protein [Hyphococcus flavus]